MRRHLAFAGRVPPKEIQLWDVGANPTDYGVHLWTDRSIAEVFGAYQARGNPIQIDLEHNVGKGPEVPDPLAPTGGYASLDVRDGAPWLTFEWSAIADEQITTGQRRYLSPEYLTDETTGEIIALVRVSLVASPGTHHARVLASKKEVRMDPLMLAALRAACASGDIASVEALVAELEKATGSAAAESPAEGDVAAAGGDEAGDKPKPFAPTSGGSEEPKPADAVAAAADEPVAAGADEPVAAAADDKKPAMASAPRQPPPVPTLAKRVQANRVSASTAHVGPTPQDAIDRVDNLERDTLLRAEGDRLIEPIRVWASSQPLSVVRGLIDAAPKRLASTPLVTGTRGGTLGPTGVPVKRHLTGEDRRTFEGLMHDAPLKPIGPSRNASGNLVMTSGCPGEYRRQQAAAAAGKK